jgi:hypothetical protein
MLLLTPRFARCRDKHRLRRHLPPEEAARRWLDETTTGEAAQLTAPANSRSELLSVGLMQRHWGRGLLRQLEVPAVWAERNRVDPKAHAMNLLTKAEAVMGLTSLPVHARRLAVAHVDSGSSEPRLHAPAGDDWNVGVLRHPLSAPCVAAGRPLSPRFG